MSTLQVGIYYKNHLLSSKTHRGACVLRNDSLLSGAIFLQSTKVNSQ